MPKSNSGRMPLRLKQFIEFRLETYPEDKRQLSEYYADLMPSSVADYSGMPKAPGGNSRPTENKAEKLVSDPYIIVTSKTVRAIDRVISGLDDTDRRLIDLIYWKKTHTVEGAAMQVNLSRSSAFRHVRKILRSIAISLGYFNM